MASHRTKDRRKPLRDGALGCVSGFSVTFQNNSLGWFAAYGPYRPSERIHQSGARRLYKRIFSLMSLNSGARPNNLSAWRKPLPRLA